MDEQQVREWLAKRMRWEAIPDNLWDLLREDDYVSEAIFVPDLGLQELLARARSLVKLFAISPGRTGDVSAPLLHQEGEGNPRLEEQEKAHAEGLAQLLGRLAAERPRVRRFRREILDGILTPEQAHAFVDSRALAIFPRRWFTQLGVPYVGHQSQVQAGERVERGDGLDWRRITASFEPQGISFSALVCLERENTFEFPLRYRGEVHSRSYGIPHPVAVLPGSVLDELRELASWLSGEYAWEEALAAWFVLTDEVPPVPAIQSGYRVRRGHDYHYVRINLSVDGWVSAAAVARAYQDVQRRFSDRRPRSLGRGLAVVRFVSEQAKTTGRRPPWRKLVEQWDRTHPEKAYDRNVRNFQRDYDRAERALLFPYDAASTKAEHGPRPSKLPTVDSKPDSKASRRRQT